MKKGNNKGFTLIELIVVIAIMAVAGGVTNYSLSLISSSRAKQCAEHINDSLEYARTAALSREGECKITFLVKDDGVYIEREWLGTSEKIGFSKCEITYVKAGVTYNLESQPLIIVFDKSTGAFKSTDFAKEIIVSGGGRVYTITCYQLTGKTELK